SDLTSCRAHVHRLRRLGLNSGLRSLGVIGRNFLRLSTSWAVEDARTRNFLGSFRLRSLRLSILSARCVRRGKACTSSASSRSCDTTRSGTLGATVCSASACGSLRCRGAFRRLRSLWSIPRSVSPGFYWGCLRGSRCRCRSRGRRRRRGCYWVDTFDDAHTTWFLIGCLALLASFNLRVGWSLE